MQSIFVCPLSLAINLLYFTISWNYWDKSIKNKTLGIKTKTGEIKAKKSAKPGKIFCPFILRQNQLSVVCRRGLYMSPPI